MPLRTLLLGLACTLPVACTWVRMEPGGAAVRVARASEDLSACQRLGEIAVAVKDRVGLYRRDPIKVRDELEVLARNEAPRLNADTLQAVDEPIDGEQRWRAYQCGDRRARGPTGASAARAPAGAAETFPVRDD